jgi:DNA-binding response OmpR family regulator
MARSTLLLLIEDDLNDREMFVQAVHEIIPSFKCLTAANVTAAMSMLRAKDFFIPDLIFVKLNLPSEDGKVLLKKINHDPLLKHIPVIIYTNAYSLIESAECIELGAAGFITRPHSFDDIRNALRTILNKNKMVKKAIPKKGGDNGL